MNKEIMLPADQMYIPAVEVRAGDLRALYEKGRLRYIYAGNMEIVRMIYPALRDRNWSTIIPVTSEEKISRQQRSFSISYSALYHAGDIRYRAFYKIEGQANNTIVFSMKGEALSDFKKRRIGLCLLHPVQGFSGRDIEVVQPDGTSYNALFPEYVSPFQPFLNVQGMKLITGNRVFFEIKYEGEVFETEDQRNWADNSYKSYSTPLSKPSPAAVSKGNTVEQVITVRADTKQATESKTTAAPAETRQPLPRIGYAMAKDGPPLTIAQAELLQKVPFDHYKVQLDMGSDWKTVWSRAVKEAAMIGTKIELALNFSDLGGQQLAGFLEEVASDKHLVSSVLVLCAGHETAPADFFESTYTAIKNALGNIPAGYGTSGDFADLNGNRPPEAAYDFVSFHLQPQVHTVDTRSIVDNLGSYESLIASTEKFAADKPVHISTVNFSSGDSADTRFPTAFAAWWTLQALRNLAAAASVTFYAVTGHEGLLQDGVNPVYEALTAIKDFSPQYVLQHTGNKVIFENSAGERLVFRSKMPGPDSI